MTDLNVKERTKTGNGLMKKIKKTLKFDSTEPAAPQVDLMIDYPLEGEKIRKGSYAIRISAPPNSDVEISINNGEWQPCRESIGYWWFDWTPMGDAPCKLAVRSRMGTEKWKNSAVRSCEIVDSDQPLNVGLIFD